MKISKEHIGYPLGEKWCDLIKDYTTKEDRKEAILMMQDDRHMEGISIHTLNALLNGQRNVTEKNRPILNALSQLAFKRKSLKPVL